MEMRHARTKRKLEVRRHLFGAFWAGGAGEWLFRYLPNMEKKECFFKTGRSVARLLTEGRKSLAYLEPQDSMRPGRAV